MAVKRDWKGDQIINLNPDDPGHREMLWRRFDHMVKKGCTLFYPTRQGLRPARRGRS
jgi:hypothetical protein